MIPAIRTKLYPPVSRAPLIERARLMELLDRHRDCALILVAAPAGFGKTTLLGQWFERRKRSGEHCCWCSLDRQDSQPDRFLRHLLSALRTVTDAGADLLRQVDTALADDITATLPPLVNELADAGREIVLFIDDWHTVRSAEVSRFMELLVQTAPANFHLVIASRLRPALSLSALRVRARLFEITANELRFDAREADEFIRRAAKLDLNPEQLERLYEHSEGWAAGLQLASLSMHDPARRDALLGSFSGSLREIADYLASDVLNQQEPETRDFLLRTSILDRLCAGAAAAVTGNPDAAGLLRRVEAANLFLVPLDATGEWYRYHHLFQEFLLAELRRTYPDEIVSLYRRASDWFSAAGLFNEAVNYALLSGDTLRVGQLVHSGTLERLAMDGKMTAWLSWLSGIPQSIKAKFPRLLIQEGIALCHLYRPAAAAEAAEQARAAIERLPQVEDYRYTEAEIDQIREESAILPFLVGFCRDELDRVDTGPLLRLRTRDDLVLGIANNLAGYGHLMRHRLEEAEQHFARARLHHVRKGTYYGAVFSDCFAAMVSLLVFRLRDAYAHALAAGRLVEDIDGGHAPGTGKACVMQAVVLYEWNRIDEALDLLRVHVPHAEAAGQIRVPQLGLLARARCHAALGRTDMARADLRRCLEISAQASSEFIRLEVETELGRIDVLEGRPPAAGDPARARALLERLAQDWNREDFAALFLELQRAVFAGVPVRETLAAFRAMCRRRGLVQAEIDLLLLSAIGSEAEGDGDSALDALDAAVTIAFPENGIRRFLDLGDRLRPLLARLAGRHAQGGDPRRRRFIAQVEEAFAAVPATARNGAGNGLIEALSSRECEILELMARGDSNAAISERLGISENTVKWHIKNLFAKLGVSNRTAAVAAARRHRLLAQPAGTVPFGAESV